MHDFFPLVRGSVREYATENAQGNGTLKIEVLSVSTSEGRTTAKCRRTIRWNDKPAEIGEFEAVNDGKEIRTDAGIEFKLPVKVGTEWVHSPRRYWIEALDVAIETPGGKFKNCMRVAYLIAEGDGGSGERHYAPGVGLVKIVEHDEAHPFTHQLVKKSG